MNMVEQQAVPAPNYGNHSFVFLVHYIKMMKCEHRRFAPPHGICCYEIKAFAVIFHISLYSYSLAPEYQNSYEFREYSNCLWS